MIPLGIFQRVFHTGSTTDHEEEGGASDEEVRQSVEQFEEGFAPWQND